ncbi:hypothetical protein [Streptomyces sp. Rer75]|uniref:AMP-binding enzyme n=1 Tax=unclassified Streptomyces TaxID=2593676 RepID=UPI0015D02C9C|nr:hypothetical protein [Streptomyces sp. Rer75]QLH25378.1 hypothetical protein HYQ63_36110 [Streptomyces sp. Rer75]
MPDAFLGERICVYVVPTGRPPTLAELRELMKSRGVAGYKLPDRLELVDTFPLTGLGKIDKKVLAARIAATASNPLKPAQRENR